MAFIPQGSCFLSLLLPVSVSTQGHIPSGGEVTVRIPQVQENDEPTFSWCESAKIERRAHLRWHQAGTGAIKSRALFLTRSQALNPCVCPGELWHLCGFCTLQSPEWKPYFQRKERWEAWDFQRLLAMCFRFKANVPSLLLGTTTRLWSPASSPMGPTFPYLKLPHLALSNLFLKNTSIGLLSSPGIIEFGASCVQVQVHPMGTRDPSRAYVNPVHVHLASTYTWNITSGEFVDPCPGIVEFQPWDPIMTSSAWQTLKAGHGIWSISVAFVTIHRVLTLKTHHPGTWNTPMLKGKKCFDFQPWHPVTSLVRGLHWIPGSFTAGILFCFPG